MSTPPRPHSDLREYRTALDLGCRVHRLGGIRVWRTIKAISQLVVIGFCFWGAVSGNLNPTIAFGGMISAYLGAEGVETILLAAGQNAATIRKGQEQEQQQEDAEPDGGAVVVETEDNRDG